MGRLEARLRAVLDVLGYRDQGDPDTDYHDADRRCHRPVKRDAEKIDDDIADHEGIGSADERGGDEVARRAARM